MDGLGDARCDLERGWRRRVAVASTGRIAEEGRCTLGREPNNVRGACARQRPVTVNFYNKVA